MIKKWLKLLPCAVCLVLAGCATTGSVSVAINNYQQVAAQIQLGQSKKEVLDILLPTQAALDSRFAKPSEQYLEGDKLKEIYFFRSRSFSDGLVTDDEFIPYVFEEGKLVAIGWTAIGGPKTQAQRRDNDVHYPSFHGRMYF